MDFFTKHSTGIKSKTPDPYQDTRIRDAIIAQDQGDYEKAIKLFLSLQSYLNLTDLNRIIAIKYLIVCYRHLEEYESSLPIAKNYVEIIKKVIDNYSPDVLWAKSLNEQVKCLTNLRCYADGLQELATVQIGMKTYDEALKTINLSLILLDKYNLHISLEYGLTFMRLGSLYYSEEKYSDALVGFYKAKNILSNYNEKDSYLEVVSLLARCHEKRNEYKEALILLKELALHYSKDATPLLTMLSINTLATFYANLKQYEKAILFNLESLKVGRAIYGISNPRVSKIQVELKLLQENVDNLKRESINVGHNFRMCNTCENIIADMDECLGCHKAWYCNSDCQLKDWDIHKPNCCVCFYCSTPIDRESKYLRCSRCKKARYCNVECQKNNWKEHKKDCVAAE